MVKEVSHTLEWATEDNDTGLMHRALKDLGNWLQPGAARGTIEVFISEQGAGHLKHISGSANEVDMQKLLDHMPAQREVDHSLARVPAEEEILDTLGKMRERAAGDDELTTNTLRQMAKTSDRFRRAGALCPSRSGVPVVEAEAPAGQPG